MASSSRAGSGGRLGLGMMIAAWVLALGLLTYAFESHLSRERNPNRNLTGQITESGAREVALERNRHGHYLADGEINGHAVTFMIDTGASDVSIPARIGEDLGLRQGRAVTYQTASGRIEAHATNLEELSLGPIALRDVRASLNPYMDSDTILLGMSVLRELELEQRGTTLTLRQPPRRD